jgi:hypothetical protein
MENLIFISALLVIFFGTIAFLTRPMTSRKKRKVNRPVEVTVFFGGAIAIIDV